VYYHYFLFKYYYLLKLKIFFLNSIESKKNLIITNFSIIKMSTILVVLKYFELKKNYFLIKYMLY